MDTYIDGRFERLEKALANLIDSVNKYHPSTVHARELEAADEELTKGLEQSTLSRHPTYSRAMDISNKRITQFKPIRSTTSASNSCASPPPRLTLRSRTP
jgi:hypothetical protein